MQQAVNGLWNFTDDMFFTDEVEETLIKKSVVFDNNPVREQWTHDVTAMLARATLTHPDQDNFMRIGGKQGLHSEYLGFILAEMQFLPRAYPDATW